MQNIILDMPNGINHLLNILKNNLIQDLSFSNKDENQLNFYASDDSLLQLKLAEVLTDYIVEFEEKKMLRKLLFSDYPFFTSAEKNKIFDDAVKLINNTENDFLKMLVLLKRRFLIKQNILEYLSENNYLNLNGFLSFRLLSYKKMLVELIQKVIEDYKLEKEYKEFIDMLKFFVETQKNRTSKIHIIFEENGEYMILNEKNKNITKTCFDEFSETKEKNDLNNEDVLISSLITLAPKKLFLHFESENYNKKIVNTIEQIFENKVCVSSEPLLKVVR